MRSINDYLTEDHHACDDLFAEAENAVAANDWTAAEPRFQAFRDATLRHFAREEAVLFPAFETASGMTGGPTWVMRDEHARMREALDALSAAVGRRDAEGYLGHSETLLMLMGQHNMKEEQILYRMCDQVLVAQAEDLLGRMREQSEAVPG